MQKRENAITLKGGGLTLIGPALKVGDKAPAFVCAIGMKDTLAFSATPAKARLFNVVPSLDTPVCSIQTKKFGDALAKFSDAVACYTVSMDLPFGQKRWCGAEDVTNVQTLSAHRCTKFGEDYGVLIKGGPLDRCLTRAVFVVQPDGRIKHVEYCSEIASEPNYDAAFAAAVS